jgi:hypothetical protein
MELSNVAKKVPASIREIVVEKLMDLILNSKNAGNMPSGLAKTILYYWQRDVLTTDVGMERLLEAAVLLEPEATVTTLGTELGLQEVAIMLKEATIQ